MQRSWLTRRRTVQLGAAAGSAAVARRARAAAPVQLISHRYPALEFWANKMKTAVPGVEVNAQLMPFDKALELATIALSSKADTLDLVYASDSTVQTFAKNSWIRPLDDLWARYKQEFKLDDYADEVMKLFTRDGHIYVIPAGINVMMLYYRRDLFDAAGKKVPTTVGEYQDLAKSFNTPMRAGTINCLKPVDACLNEAHWYMNTIGPGWFDADWKPVFNTDPGVRRDRILARNDALRATGVRHRCERRMCDCPAAGPGGDGISVGHAGELDGRSEAVARYRQDRLGDAAAGARADQRGWLRDLGLQQAGPGHTVPYRRDGDVGVEHARGIGADAGAAAGAAERSGPEGEEPILPGGNRQSVVRHAVPADPRILPRRRVYCSAYRPVRDRGNANQGGAGCGGSGN